MYDFHKVLFLLPSKNQLENNKRDTTPVFVKSGELLRLFTSPPKNQCLQMLFWRRIIISTATNNLKH
tara:strand:+ start:395 stop:595 length:201 start_codon:yes stop_codon:yes gene_type:complete